MKFTTNFTDNKELMHGYVIIVMWLASLVLGFGLLYMYMHVNENQEKVEIYQLNTGKLIKRLKEIQQENKETITQDDLQALNERVKKVNSYKYGNGVAVNKVLNYLESILNKKTYITSFSYKKESGKVLLKVVSRKNTGIVEFLGELEKNSSLTDVRMLKKEQARRKGVSFVSADITFFMTEGVMNE